MMGRVAIVGVLALLVGTGGFGDSHKITVYLRGKPQRVRIYEPAPGAPRRAVQVLVVSGDLGWLGISRNVPGHLQAQGYRVVALNAQTYVAGFTGRNTHLTDEQVARDFDTIVEAANAEATAPAPYVSLGVSEGAGLAVVAAGHPASGPNCRGVIGLGLPALTALGWRWTDFVSWITKKEPHEAEVETRLYLRTLHVPLVVIHSLHDEYDPIAHIQGILAEAPGPVRLIPIDAPNHRFSHHIDEVLGDVDTAIPWILSARPVPQAAATR